MMGTFGERERNKDLPQICIEDFGPDDRVIVECVRGHIEVDAPAAVIFEI